MPTIRLTKRAIKSVPFATSGQVLFRDDELTGFGLRVGARAKTFFAEGQVRRRTIRVTIGRYPLMSPEEARRNAFEHLAAMSRGVDPTQEKKAAEGRVITVEEAFDAFFEAKLNLSPCTVANYRRTPSVYLKDWLRTPSRISRATWCSRGIARSAKSAGRSPQTVSSAICARSITSSRRYTTTFRPIPCRCCPRRAHGRQSDDAAR